MRSGFRFDPPPIEVGPEVPWLLGAAFAAIPPPGKVPVDGGLVVSTGGVLDLVPRIGARFDLAVLAEAVGRETAERIKAQTRATAGQGLRVRTMAGQLGKIARDAGIEAVIAKGGALLLLDAVPARGEERRRSRCSGAQGRRSEAADCADRCRMDRERSS